MRVFIILLRQQPAVRHCHFGVIRSHSCYNISVTFRLQKSPISVTVEKSAYLISIKAVKKEMKLSVTFKNGARKMNTTNNASNEFFLIGNL